MIKVFIRARYTVFTSSIRNSSGRQLSGMVTSFKELHPVQGHTRSLNDACERFVGDGYGKFRLFPYDDVEVL